MTIRDVLAALDTESTLALWDEECGRDELIRGLSYPLDEELLQVLISEVEIEPEETYDPPPSVISTVIQFTEATGSSGLALRQFAALGRALIIVWRREDASIAQDLLARTQAVLVAWMVMVASRALQELDRLAHIDEMTGLFNKRAFRRDLGRALEDSVRPVAVVFADIDGLKHVNDSEGHEAGNDMIRSFAAALSNACSGPGRKAYRWGGDEHALLLIGASVDDASVVMDRTRETFEQFSWGFASAPDDGDTVGELMDLSDDRMYVAKEGRKRALWEHSRILGYVARTERKLTTWRKELEARARARAASRG